MDRWAHLGHALGECWVDEVNDLTYIHIPKNASSFVKGVLMGCGGFWQHNDSLVTSKENLIILRDPIDRWCSGIAQYLQNSGQDLTNDEIFNKITFDDHTELQSYFLNGVELSTSTFMLVNEDLRFNLANWLTEHGFHVSADTFINYNTSIDEGRGNVKNHYVKLLEEQPELVLKLQQHFEQDYKLIGSVKLYGT